jgi:DNA mismatch repair ATPase MutS
MHCYLNIPDTNGRDSLFQAEARRCKSILDSVEQSPQSARHICFIDELFSGTNPEEAVRASEGLLRYLVDDHQMCFILTTHFVSLCKRLKHHDKMENWHLSVLRKDKRLCYTYKLKRGISKMYGAAEVLRTLQYPHAIVKQVEDDQHDEDDEQKEDQEPNKTKESIQREQKPKSKRSTKDGLAIRDNCTVPVLA